MPCTSFGLSFSVQNVTSTRGFVSIFINPLSVRFREGRPAYCSTSLLLLFTVQAVLTLSSAMTHRILQSHLDVGLILTLILFQLCAGKSNLEVQNSNKTSDTDQRENPFVGTLAITDNLLDGLNQDQINQWLEKINYVIFGLPISWILNYVIIYAYTYFAVYTSKWIVSELNRGGDLKNPVNYSWDKFSHSPSDFSLSSLEKTLQAMQDRIANYTTANTQAYTWEYPQSHGQQEPGRYVVTDKPVGYGSTSGNSYGESVTGQQQQYQHYYDSNFPVYNQLWRRRSLSGRAVPNNARHGQNSRLLGQ